MRNYKNLPNLLLVVSVFLIVGLACSDDEVPSARKDVSRPTEIRNSTENRENVNTSNENMSNTFENTSENTSEKTPTNVDRTKFYSVLDYTLDKKNLKRSDICNEQDVVQKRILEEYGAVFLTTENPPVKCMFQSDSETISFQNKVSSVSETINGATVELQTNAMKALLAAREEAKSQGLDITPRGGSEASKRGFSDTLRLWNSRFEPACKHWKAKGKLTDEQINKLKSLGINEQVKEVLELEKQGIYFSTVFDKSILSSVAAPGTSQHLSMLAFDATEFANPKVRNILANHGWFRTVKGDAPHFTYLGVKGLDVQNLGLKKFEDKDGEFWLPNI